VIFLILPFGLLGFCLVFIFLMNGLGLGLKSIRGVMLNGIKIKHLMFLVNIVAQVNSFNLIQARAVDEAIQVIS
jgi:hypothetical protein